MKKILKRFTAVACLAVLFTLSSCSTDYYEPVFYDKFPELIPAIGGVYSIDYDYTYYATKANKSYFDWSYRVIISGKVAGEYDVDGASGNTVVVNIPANGSVIPRTVVVETSTHVAMGSEDWWGDWTPICSAVQLGI